MIRSYISTDYNDVLKLFHLNVSVYFAPEEEVDLIHYLTAEIEDYFVLEIAGEIVGSGGINYKGTKDTAYISWDFVHPDFQGKGIGSRLVQHRFQLLKENPKINKIVVRTSQLAYLFYQKCGFEIRSIEKDYWAKGYDLVEMEIILS